MDEFDKVCPPIVGARCKYCGKDAVFEHNLRDTGFAAWCANCTDPAMNVGFTFAGSPEAAIRRWNREEH